MFIIAGLGNPGRKYERTKHNVGFVFIDYFSELCGVQVKKLRFKSLTGECLIGGEKVILLKPQTFMNLSGEAVREALDYYGLSTDRLLVVHDDIAMLPGSLRIRKKGSDGGHNGIKSIICQLGSDEFARIKIGVGMPDRDRHDVKDWVLSSFGDGEGGLVSERVRDAAKAAELIVAGQTERAMDIYNVTVKPKKAEDEQKGTL